MRDVLNAGATKDISQGSIKKLRNWELKNGAEALAATRSIPQSPKVKAVLKQLSSTSRRNIRVGVL